MNGIFEIQDHQYENRMQGIVNIGSGLPNFNERCDWGRFIVEALLYVSMIGRVFINQLGIVKIQGLSGAIICLSGLCCAIIMITKRERFPTSFYFILTINIAANISQVIATGQPPIFGDFLRPLLFWICHLLMACYVVRNDTAAARFILIISICVIIAVSIGAGVQEAGIVGVTIQRLQLEGVGSMFANANELAIMSAILAIGLLFYSLWAKSFLKPLYWILSLILIYTALKTVSRSGVVLLLSGFLCFVMAITFGKGGKISFILLIILTVFVAGKYSYELITTREVFLLRFGQAGQRIETWFNSIDDLFDTLIIGRGALNVYVGVALPHNMFFYFHLAFGGICGWTYVLWTALLAIRIWRMFLSNEVTAQHKFLVIAMFSMYFMGASLLVYSISYYAVLAIAIIEKYTAPFSKKRIAQRTVETAYLTSNEYLGPIITT
jgi:hypothetical protein